MKDTEDEMNSVYAALLKKYRGQPAVQTAIRAAQLRWRAYHDSFLNSYFPDVAEIRGVWGSQMAECSARYDIAITLERTIWLKQMLDDLSTGNVQPPAYADLCPFPF